MAYKRYKRYKKSGFKGYYGRTLYRRSRRYRNKYWRRKRYRKRSGAKIEYKRVEKSLSAQFMTQVERVRINNSFRLFQMIKPYPYAFMIVGGSDAQSAIIPNVSISQGTGYSQRIGNRINPIRLRLFGTMTLIPGSNPNVDNNGNVVKYEDIKLTQPVFLRFLVIQLNGGNNVYSAVDRQFSAVNPYVVHKNSFTFGNLQQNELEYNASSSTEYVDIDWFTRVFQSPSTYTNVVETDTNNGTNEIKVWQGYDAETNSCYSSAVLLKTPFKQGIGGNFRVLKNKVYKVHPTTSQSVSFRFKTKKPSRLVWPEGNAQDNNSRTLPKNPIYIVLIPVFPYPTYSARLNINMGMDMSYTDI